MKIHLLNRILVIGLMVLLVTPVQAVEEKDLIAILQSSAGAPAKCAACQQLRIYGTAQSVSILESLLGAERVDILDHVRVESPTGYTVRVDRCKAS